MRKPIAIILLLLSAGLSRTGFGQTLQGTHPSPYKSIDASQPMKLLPAFMRPTSDSVIKSFNSKESLWGEAQALLYEFHQYNLSAPPVKTDGYTGFEDADRPFMAMAYAGLAICNLAQKYPELKDEAQKETRWLLNAIQSPAISGFMTPHFGEPFSKQPLSKTSVFVHGHFLYLALRYRETFGAHDLDSTIHKIATALNRDFIKNTILPSYTQMWYISDNLAALAALRNYDKVFKTSLSQKPVELFLLTAKKEYIDDSTGMLYTYVEPSGKKVGRPDGVGTMYGLMYLPEIDSSMARTQWQLAKKFMIREFSQLIAANKQTAPLVAMAGSQLAGLYVCLQHPLKTGVPVTSVSQNGSDSGPIFLGAGTSASAFAVAAANRMGDRRIADGLEKFAIKIGNPTWVENRLYYLNMFHVVGQAVVFFGKTEKGP